MARVVLITGGSRGIGAATARLAASRGYDVCVNYRSNETPPTRWSHEIAAAGATRDRGGADVAIEADVVRLFEACDRALGV